MFSTESLDAAVDESLPEGVIEIQDDAGLWWRFPLVEYVDD